MKPWIQAFDRFGYCSIPLQDITGGATTNEEIEAFAQDRKLKVIRTCVVNGEDTPLNYSVGLTTRKFIDDREARRKR